MSTHSTEVEVDNGYEHHSAVQGEEEISFAQKTGAVFFLGVCVLVIVAFWWRFG